MFLTTARVVIVELENTKHMQHSRVASVDTISLILIFTSSSRAVKNKIPFNDCPFNEELKQP